MRWTGVPPPGPAHAQHTGGALFGLAKGMFLLFIAMWLLNLWGNRTVLDAVAEDEAPALA
jgi:hypothetical protein